MRHENSDGVVLGLAAVAACAGEHYGAALTMKDPLTLEVAVQSLGDRPTADELVQSTVAKVCEQRGCWIALKSASSQLHVTFKLTKAGPGYELVASGLEVQS